MKKVGKFIAVFFILLGVFVTLLIVTSIFPSKWIEKNVKESANILIKEGNRKNIFSISSFQYQEFDNYSDALMINTAYSIDNKTPLYSALTAKKDYIPGVTKTINEDKVGELSSSSKYEEHDEVAELLDTVNGEAPEAFEYAKYWHGYLVILRPLLLLFNYWQIRILLIVILSLLAIWLLYLIATKISKAIASIFFISLIQIEYFYIGLSLLNSSMLLIMMISSIFLIKRYKKIKNFSLFFFVIGILVGFFDLLDIPLITFGGPLIIYFVLKCKLQKIEIKEGILEIIKFGILWLFGYALMWISKWILIDIVYGRNILSTALGQVLYRTVGENISPLTAISVNLLKTVIPIIINLILLEYLLMRYCKKITKENLRKSVLFFIIALMPIVWYIFLSNHSYYHYFFTYRILFLSQVAIPVGLYIACGEPEDIK
ncbi:MAG: hypothetical protein HFJ45_02220 [Clostridia bacterium]|nr:hypothetical protein [Clostridia bacterium]